MKHYNGLTRQQLDESHYVWCGKIPGEICLSSTAFEELWASHPPDRHRIRMAGRWVETPRWQQTFGRDYRYTGNVNRALPIPPMIEPYLEWAKQSIEQRLNGLLVNWYDAERRDYIGKHRDSTHNLVLDVPIVTISFGGERIFRLRPYRGEGFVDLPTFHGSVLLLPYDTNRFWSHEVLKPKATPARHRISITVRAFNESLRSDEPTSVHLSQKNSSGACE